jgi:hypothetical protein
MADAPLALFETPVITGPAAAAKVGAPAPTNPAVETR